MQIVFPMKCACGHNASSSEDFEVLNGKDYKKIQNFYCNHCSQAEIDSRLNETEYTKHLLKAFEYLLNREKRHLKPEQHEGLHVLDEVSQAESSTVKNIHNLTKLDYELAKLVDEGEEMENDLRSSEYIYQQRKITSKKLSLLSLFDISIYKDSPAVINGLRFGRGGVSKTPYTEINAAWGQCALLMECLVNIHGIELETARIYPSGPFSRIKANRELYPLFYQPKSASSPTGTLEFDKGMELFLQMIKEISVKTGIPLHHAISEDFGRVGGLEIRHGAIDWDGALAATLDCLKTLKE